MYEISRGSYENARQARAAQAEIRSLRGQLQALRAQAGQGELTNAIAALQANSIPLEGVTGGGRRGRAGPGRRAAEAGPTFGALASEFNALMNDVERADAEPTLAVQEAYASATRTLNELLPRWTEVKTTDVPALNQRLKQANLPAINIEPVPDPDEPSTDPGSVDEG
jgi:hypothetical protein